MRRPPGRQEDLTCEKGLPAGTDEVLEAAAAVSRVPPGGTTPPNPPEPSAVGSAGNGGRWGRRWRSGSGPARCVQIALAQERRPPGLLPQRAGTADQRQGGGGAGDPGHRGEQGQHGGEHGPGQDGRGQGGQSGGAHRELGDVAQQPGQHGQQAAERRHRHRPLNPRNLRDAPNSPSPRGTTYQPTPSGVVGSSSATAVSSRSTSASSL